MKVIEIFEGNHGFLGVAKTPKDAITYLIKTGWLTEQYDVTDIKTGNWTTISILLGSNWIEKLKSYSVNELNDIFNEDDGFYFEEQEIIEYNDN